MIKDEKYRQKKRGNDAKLARMNGWMNFPVGKNKIPEERDVWSISEEDLRSKYSLAQYEAIMNARYQADPVRAAKEEHERTATRLLNEWDTFYKQFMGKIKYGPDCTPEIIQKFEDDMAGYNQQMHDGVYFMLASAIGKEDAQKFIANHEKKANLEQIKSYLNKINNETRAQQGRLPQPDNGREM